MTFTLHRSGFREKKQKKQWVFLAHCYVENRISYNELAIHNTKKKTSVTSIGARVMSFCEISILKKT